MKKIISLIAAAAMFTSIGVASVSAALADQTIKISLSTPEELTSSEFADYNDYLENEMGEDPYVIPTGYKAYKVTVTASDVPTQNDSAQEIRIAGWDIAISVGEDLAATQPSVALETFHATPAAGNKNGSYIAIAQTVTKWSDIKKATTGDNDLGTLIIVAKEGAVGTVTKADVTLYRASTKTAYLTEAGDIGKSVLTSTLTFGAPVPPPSDDFAADKDATTGEVTFANTDKATDTSSEFMTALEDNKVKLFNDKLTGVKADSRFTITYTPTGETKTFGHTIGEHFGISGDGAIEGTVAIALLFDKALDPTGFALEY